VTREKGKKEKEERKFSREIAHSCALDETPKHERLQICPRSPPPVYPLTFSLAAESAHEVVAVVFVQQASSHFRFPFSFPQSHCASCSVSLEEASPPPRVAARRTALLFAHLLALSLFIRKPAADIQSNTGHRTSQPSMTQGFLYVRSPGGGRGGGGESR